MTARRAWLLGAAVAALVAMLVIDLTGLAWPRLDRTTLLAQIAWVGLLGLGQQLSRRPGDLAAGGAVVLGAALAIALAPSMGLGATLAGTLLVVASATITQAVLAQRVARPEWLGLGALLLLLAATPDVTGRLAPEPLRAFAAEPAFAAVPWQAVVYLAALALAVVRRSWLGAALIWWVLGLLAAGAGQLGVEQALLWTAQGLAVSAWAEDDLPAGALAAVVLGCGLYAAGTFGSPGIVSGLTAVALVAGARGLRQSAPAEDEPA